MANAPQIPAQMPQMMPGAGAGAGAAFLQPVNTKAVEMNATANISMILFFIALHFLSAICKRVNKYLRIKSRWETSVLQIK